MRKLKGLFLRRAELRLRPLAGQPILCSKEKSATALLKDGRVFLSGLYSEKTGKTYDATIVLDDTGKYVNFNWTLEGNEYERDL